MTLNQFISLSREEQVAIVLKDGAPLMQLENGGFTIALHQLSGFYIELFFLKQNNQIIWINSFEDLSKLAHYLHKIDLSPLADCLHKAR
ncbi:hypothetical protein V9K67_17475 [Paraflavisolibacter sp. H34]|uniref:hypothetical protein n=1 Tax=Huijunlia imazamoxiresistens TaxID=3127457 RepID=UPI003018BD0E